MSIQKVEAKLENIDRKIFRGKKTTLHLIDRFDGNTVIAKIKIWNWTNLTPTGEGNQPTYLIRVAQDSVATKERLQKYDLALNGVVHHVVDRVEPEGNKEVLWVFRTYPENEKIST